MLKNLLNIQVFSINKPYHLIPFIKPEINETSKFQIIQRQPLSMLRSFSSIT